MWKWKKPNPWPLYHSRMVLDPIKRALWQPEEYLVKLPNIPGYHISCTLREESRKCLNQMIKPSQRIPFNAKEASALPQLLSDVQAHSQPPCKRKLLFVSMTLFSISEDWYIDQTVNSEHFLKFSSLFAIFITEASLQTLHLSVQIPTLIPPCQVNPLTLFPASLPINAPETQGFHHIQLSPLFDWFFCLLGTSGVIYRHQMMCFSPFPLPAATANVQIHTCWDIVSKYQGGRYD